MGQLKTGFTTETINNFQLNAGVLLSSYTAGEAIAESAIIGATQGGGTINISAVMHNISVDGAPENTVGLRRKDYLTASLSFTMIEFKSATITKAIVGSSATTDTNTVITSVTDILTSSDYSDVYWVGDLSDGRLVVIYLKNAINTAGLSLKVSDKGEGTFEMTLEANYSTDDIYNDPYSITFIAA